MAPTTRTTRSCAKIPSLTGAQIEKPGIAENKPTAGESSARRKVLPGKKQPPTSSRQLTRLDHIILEGVNDSKVFLDMFYWPDVDLTRIRVLEVHLNATKPDEYADYRLTRVLNELQPNADGTNPHNLHAVKLVVKGNVLYTRYSYSLASPAMSQDASDGLRKLVTNGLSEQEKINLRYKVYGTEKIVARALLGIRGVRQVVIEGKGKMEGQFAETIKATLIQPPGTSISEQGRALVPNSTGWLYGEGLFASGTWDLIMKEQSLNHLFSPSEESTQHTNTSRPSTRASLRESNVDNSNATTSASNKRKHSQGELGMESMVRTRVRRQDVEDGGLSRMWKGSEEYDLPLVLTGKGGSVEMGWKVR